MIPINPLEYLFLKKLMSLCDIENEIKSFMPLITGSTSDPELKEMFEEYLDQINKQITRIEDSFNLLDEKVERQKTNAIRGIYLDIKWIAKNIKLKEAKDAALLAEMRTVIHYKIANYDTISEWASLLDRDEISEMLEDSLSEEKASEERLSKLSISGINERANQAIDINRK